MTNAPPGSPSGPAASCEVVVDPAVSGPDVGSGPVSAPGEAGPGGPRDRGIPHRSIRSLPGMAALAVSALGLVALIVGVSVAAARTADAGDWAFASAVAVVANVLTAVGVLGGLVAVVARRGRPWGVAAMVLGVAANPFVLVTLFAALA